MVFFHAAADRLSGNIALAAATGVLLSLSLPIVGFSSIALAALIPFFFFAKDRRTSARRLLFGTLLVGTIYGIATIIPILAVRGSWWTGSLRGIGAGDPMLGVLFSAAVIVVGVIGAVFVLLPFAFAFWKITTPLGRLVAGALFAILEWIRSTFLVFGYSWGALGYSLLDVPILRDLAHMPGGVFLLSAVVVVVNMAIFEVIFHDRHSHVAQGTKLFRARFLQGFPATIAIVLIFFFAVLTKDATVGSCAIPPLRVAVVSSALSTEKSVTSAGYIYHRTRAEKALKSGANLVVMPENVFPFFVLDEATQGLSKQVWVPFEGKTEYYEDFLALSRSYPDATIVVGLHSVNEKKHYNALVFYRNGSPEWIYRRRMLVPFTEYAPFGLPIPIFEPLSPGNIEQWGNIGGRRFTGLICSEVGNAGLPIRGADIIVASSNDTVFPAPGIAATHHALARMRALESGAYVLRAVKGGISSVIAPDGAVLAESTSGDVLIADIAACPDT